MFSSKTSKVLLLSLLTFSIVAGGAFCYQQGIFNIQADKKIGAPEVASIEKIENKLLPVDNQLLVKFKSTTDKAKKDKFYAKHGATEKSEIAQIGVKVVTLTTTDPEQKAKEIRQSDGDIIEFIEPDYMAEVTLVPNDQYYTSNQANWYNIANAPGGWDIDQGDNAVIAIVDTGTDPTHPDLKDKLVPGWNYYDNTSNTADVQGHGTSTAGVASAISNNTTGVAGSSLNSKLMPMRIADANGNASYSRMASAFTYAADHGASVINISMGGTSSSSTVQSAVNYASTKNVTVIAAAGNSGAEIIEYPASATGAISVSALEPSTSFSTLAGWSTYNNSIDVSAAGCLYTTAWGGGYSDFCGTSNSAPVVAGLVALMKSINPSLTVQQVTDYLAQNSTDLGTTGWDKYFGWGRIDYTKTLTAVKSGVIPIPTKGIASGFVKDAAGNPIVNATVNATLSGTEKASVITTANGSYSMNLDPGTYTIAASATNYTKTSSSVTVSSSTTSALNLTMTITPAADTTAPTVSVTSPVAGASLKLGAKLTLGATATDNGTMSKVEFYVDGKLVSTDTASPYSASYTVNRKATIGAHTVAAKAYDSAGNTNTSTISVNFIK